MPPVSRPGPPRRPILGAMNAENFGSSERLVTAAYVRQGAQGRRAHELRLRALLEQVTGAAPRPAPRPCGRGRQHGAARRGAVGPGRSVPAQPREHAGPPGPADTRAVLPLELPQRCRGPVAATLPVGRGTARARWPGRARPGRGGRGERARLALPSGQRPYGAPTSEVALGRGKKPQQTRLPEVVRLLRRAQQTVKETFFKNNRILTYYMR